MAVDTFLFGMTADVIFQKLQPRKNTGAQVQNAEGPLVDPKLAQVCYILINTILSAWYIEWIYIIVWKILSTIT